MADKINDMNINTESYSLSADEAMGDISFIYRKLTGVNTYKDVLGIFSESLKKRISLFEVSIIMFNDNDNDKGKGKVIASSEIHDDKILTIDLDKYPEIMAAVDERKNIFIENVADSSLFDTERKKVILSKHIKSVFVMPIFDMTDIIGAVFVRSREPIKLSPFIQRYYFIQANMLASAILNISRVKSLEGYEFLFNQALEGILLINREGKVQSVNKTFLKLTGYSRAEVVGSHYSIVIANDANRQVADKIFEDYLNKKFINKFELEIKVKNGTTKNFSIRATPLAGTKDVSLISLRDITEEKLLSKELLNTTDLLFKTISSSPDAIIAADIKGKILFFNEEAAKLFGYPREEALQYIHVSQLYPQNVARGIMKLLRQSPVKHIRNYPVEILTHRGELVPVTLSGAIVYNEKGEGQMTVGYLRDEREKIKMERSLDEALSKLIEAEKNDAVTSLAGAAAHNLNQPLSAIQGYSELLILKLKDKDPSVVDYASKIINEVEKMAEIINQISKITRFEIKPYAGTTKIADITNKKS